MGQVVLAAATFCAIVGVDPAPEMQGAPLPVAATEQPGRERALCQWDSQFPAHGLHLRTIYRDGWLCTVDEPSTVGQPTGLEQMLGDPLLRPSCIDYRRTFDGPGGVGIATGELYDVVDDPHQWRNRRDDPLVRAHRDALIDDLDAGLPPIAERHLAVEAPA